MVFVSRIHCFLYLYLVFSFELGAEELSVPKAGGQSSVDSPPIIDISALLDSNNKKSAIKDDVKRRIGDACRVWGFFYVVNHGISDSLLNRIQMTQNTFFKSSYDVKRSIRRVANNSRGFSDNEFTKQIQDAKEIFDVGHKPYPHLPDFAPENIVLDGYNQWPTGEGLDTFRPIVEEYYNACASLSSTLLAAIAFDMGVDPVVFERASKNHTSFLRLNFYPKNEEADADPRAKQLELDINGNAARKEVVKERLGISRHTDAGILTILQQDGVSALEVYTGRKEDIGDGHWVPVIPVPGALTINTGDMLQVWSNGKYKAPEHRVRSPPAERFSSAFFFNPPYEEVIQPLAQTPDNGPPKYEPILWGEFRRRRFEGDYADKGKEVQIEDFLK